MRRAEPGGDNQPRIWRLARRRPFGTAAVACLALGYLSYGGHWGISDEPPAEAPAANPPAEQPAAPQAAPNGNAQPAPARQVAPAQGGLQKQPPRAAPGVIRGMRAAQFQVQAVQPGDGGELAEELVFPTDRDTLQQLDKAIELIDEKRFDEAVRVLGDILQGPEDYFYQPDRDQPIYRSLKSEAERILGKLPEAGRKSYDLQFGAEARRLLAQAQRPGDPAQLADVARRFFHTAAGYEATWLLADHHLDHGRPLSAALCLQRLQTSPQAAKWEPTLSTKLAICWARADMLSKGVEVLAHPSAGTSIEVAGEAVGVPAEEDERTNWLAALSGRPPAAAAVTDLQWVMYRGDPARAGQSQGSSPLLNARWRVPTTDDPLIERVIDQLQQAYLDQGVAAIVNQHPLVVDDIVLMRTTNNLLAVDFRTGKRLWIAAADDTLGDLIADGQSALPALSPQIAASLDQRLWDDATFGTLASDGQLVFSVEDLPLSLGFLQQRVGLIVGRNGMRRPATTGPTTYNRLAAHNIRSGKLVWELGGAPGEGELELAGAFFLGPPLPLAGRLYCLAEINSEIRLVTLDAKTGAVEWSQQLGLLERNILQDPGRRYAGLSPSYADGVLVCPTGSGAVVAVDLTSRSLLWGYRYDATTGIQVGQRFIRAQQFMALPRPRQMRQGTHGWCDSSVTISGGRVILTPVESQELHCLHLLDGQLVWKQAREDGLYVAGVHDDKVIVIGTNQLRAWQMSEGAPAWDDEVLALPEGSLPSGRGFASGARYYLPLTSGEVAAIDMDTGHLLARSRARDGRAPGNLVAYRGAVIAQGPDYVESFFQLDQIEQDVNQTLAARPDDAEALALRGEILLHSGQLAQAIDALHKAHEVVPSDPRIENLLIEALLEGLRSDFAAHEGAITRLEALVADGPQRGQFLRSLAAGQISVGRHAEAFATCLRLADPALGKPELERHDAMLVVRRDVWVSTQLAILWAEADEAQRGVMRDTLAARLDELVATGQPEGLRQYLRFFGSLPLAERARLELALRLRSDGPALERELLVAPLLDSRDRQVAAAACALVAELVLGGSQPQHAAFVLERLNGELAEVACLDGLTGRQWIERLPADGPARALLAPAVVWPTGTVRTAEAGRPSATYRAPSFDIRGRRAPYFGDTTVDHDPNKRALVARDGYGREVWRLPLVEQQDLNLPFNAQTNVAMVSGHLMILAVGPELFAIDTLGARSAAGGEPAAQGRMLWRQSLADTLMGAQGNVFINPRQLQAAWGVRRFGGAEFMMQATASLGMLTDSQVFYIKNRALVAADPLTGETQWSRRNVVPGSSIWGDRDVVVIAPPDSTEATVLRACDGFALGTCALPAPEQRLGNIGRRLLVWTTENSRSVVELRDPWPDTPVWRQTYAADAKAVLIDDDELAIFEPEGRFVILSLPDGRLLADHLLSPELNVTDIAVQRSHDHYVLMVNRPWQRARDGVYVQPIPLGLNQSPLNPLANGRVYGFDRRSRQLLWSRDIESQGIYLMQPSELPVVVFAAQVQRQVNDKNGNTQVRMECNITCVDKRTGKVLHEESFQQSAQYEVVGDPVAKTVQLSMVHPQQGSIKLYTFTDEPPTAEGQPAAADQAPPAENGEEKPAGDEPAEKDAASQTEAVAPEGAS